MQLGPIQNRVIANLLFLSFRINSLDSNIVYLVGIYVETTNKPVCLIESHSGGITHLKFSPDGSKLFSGSRKVTLLVS